MLLTVNELAKMLKLDPQTIYRKVKKNEIPFIRIGGAVRFTSEGIDKWILNKAMQSSNKRLSSKATVN